MGQGDPLMTILMARGVDVTYPYAYFQATVEAPFTGHAPTPAIKQQLIDEFITLALNEYPQGTQGEPEVVSSCLVTGQSFAMTLLIKILEPVDGTKSRTQGDGEYQSEQLPESSQTEGSSGRSEQGSRPSGRGSETNSPRGER